MADESDVEVEEYLALLETVARTDQRLLTVAGSPPGRRRGRDARVASRNGRGLGR
jgi:hypothetical protein